MAKTGTTITREKSIGNTKRAVVSGLTAFNRKAAGPNKRRQVALSLRDADGTIVGGLVGWLSWRWLFIHLLWIDEGHRRGGNGRRLMAEAEALAREAGALGVYVETVSFQAPDFYRKCGYTAFGRLDDHPPGNTHFFFAKRFA